MMIWSPNRAEKSATGLARMSSVNTAWVKIATSSLLNSPSREALNKKGKRLIGTAAGNRTMLVANISAGKVLMLPPPVIGTMVRPPISNAGILLSVSLPGVVDTVVDPLMVFCTHCCNACSYTFAFSESLLFCPDFNRFNSKFNSF